MGEAPRHECFDPPRIARTEAVEFEREGQRAKKHIFVRIKIRTAQSTTVHVNMRGQDLERAKPDSGVVAV